MIQLQDKVFLSFGDLFDICHLEILLIYYVFTRTLAKVSK